MVSRLGGSDYALLVPKEFLKGIDEDILNNEVRLREYLLSALKIGLQSFEFAGFTGSADKIEKAIRESMGKYQDFEKQFTADLDQFVEGKLTGTDSLLARKLGDSFGENGDLKARLGEIFDDISNPDKVKSVPNRVSDVIQNKFDGVEKEIASALDLASDDSPLRMFLNAQRKQFDELNTDLRNEMAQVKSALNVDAILQAQEEEKAELEEKSTHKGIHFEDDAVEALRHITGVFGDDVFHKGGEGEGGARTKVGDIVIVISQEGLSPVRIAIEAKAGNVAKKEIIKQTRDGVKNRGAACGIGLMERKYKGLTQHNYEEHGENLLVCVDWASEDWTALEVAYRALRIRLIALEINAVSEDEIDVDSIKRHLTQVKTDLGDFQSMKSGASSAINTMTELRNNLDRMETKIKAGLKAAEDLLR